MSEFIQTVPFFLPGVAVWVALGVLVSSRLAGILGTRWAVAFLLVVGLGIILFATLTPTTAARSVGVGSNGACDFTRRGIPLRWPTLRAIPRWP